VILDRHLDADDAGSSLRADVTEGMTAAQRWLPPKWFYDARGGELFDRITRLEEYYPTRAERSILQRVCPLVADVTGADTLVELGSGTSEKTRLLLGALHRTGQLSRFIPFDVDETTLVKAGADIEAELPGVVVHAVVGDFERHLDLLPAGGRRLVAFLGSTIGNLLPGPRARFLAELSATLAPGDSLLLGTDLVKDPSRLVRAYDDAEGVTAEFNRNVLRVLDRELEADFDAPRWEHVALWNPVEEWVEMRLRSEVARTVHIQALGLRVDFAAGEDIHTEVSAKFRAAGVRDELAAAGFDLTHWWTDDHGDFGLSLSSKM
jgi:dimethylhistidine N-methyltransferase